MASNVEQEWLRERLEELEKIERPSASEGEREAAEWLVKNFGALSVRARIEAERAHGTYWWPLGLGGSLSGCSRNSRRAWPEDSGGTAWPARRGRDLR